MSSGPASLVGIRAAHGVLYDAVFLDFDGVLVESVEVKTRAFATLYRKYGEDVVAKVVAHHEANGGMSRTEKLRHYHRRFLGKDLNEAALRALADEFSGLVEEAVIACPWVEGALPALSALRSRVALFILSATPTDELRRIVAQRGIADWLEGVHGAPEPKADIIRRIVAERGLAKERCLMVGDSRQDHAAARQTGIAFLGRIGRDGLNRFPADCTTVTDLTGLPERIGLA